VGRHDAVAALGPANGPVGVEPREREAIARLRGVALGLENDDLVDLALFEIQIELPVDGLGLRAGLVDLRRRPRATVWLEGHRAFERRVHAAEVERELTLDEHPYVVVAAEVQHFAAAELEPVADLAREMEITRGRAAVDAEPVVVDREESVRRIIEVVRTIELVRAVLPALEHHALQDGRVAIRVAIPVEEAVVAGDDARGGAPDGN